MSKAAATTGAFAVAASVPAMTLAGLEAIQTGRVTNFGVLLVVLLASIAVAVILALPSYLLLDRFNLVRFPLILLGGVPMSVVVGIIVLYPTEPDANSLTIFAGAGIIAGISFWGVRRLLMRRTAAGISR